MFTFRKSHSDHKHGERFDFQFSNFHALQVPKGWDKLYVSIFSVETGRTINRSGKASVRNGSCRWTDTFSESVYFSKNDDSKGSGECIFKLIVAMGSSRSGILGEAAINLAGYKSLKNSVSFSLPLKKCNHGTILKVNIQCLMPMTVVRIEQGKDTASYTEELNVDYKDMDYKSDVSDSTTTRSIGSTSSNNLDSIPQPGGLFIKVHSIADSVEGSLRESYSPRRDLSSMNGVIPRNDFTGSLSASSYGSPRMNHLPFNSKVSVSGGRSQNPRDYQYDKTGELRAEARMWEQNARKLMSNVEELQKQLSDKVMQQETLNLAFSASREECEGLRQEVKQLKTMLEESQLKKNSHKNLKFPTEDIDNIQELKCELKFQQESNSSLAVQLQKTQESNIELFSILQELELTIEEQKVQIANLSKTQLEHEGAEDHSSGYEDNNHSSGNEDNNHSSGNEDKEEANQSKRAKAKTMKRVSWGSDVKDYTDEYQLRNLPEDLVPYDNQNIELQQQQLWESPEDLKCKIQHLEKSLVEKDQEIEIEKDRKMQALKDCEAKWRGRVVVAEEKIINLEVKLSEALSLQVIQAVSFENGDNCNLVKDIDDLKRKVQELETDCNELTDENLELALKLKESRRDIKTCSTCSNSVSNKCLDNNILSTKEAELSEIKSHSHVSWLKEDLMKKEAHIGELLLSRFQMPCEDLEEKCANLELQLQALTDRTCHLDDELFKYRARSEEQGRKISVLQEELKSLQKEETKSKNHISLLSHAAMEMSKTLSELHEQIRLSTANVEKLHYRLYSSASMKCDCCLHMSETIEGQTLITQKKHGDIILNDFLQLQQLFEKKLAKCDVELQLSEVDRARLDNADEVQNTMERCNVKENDLAISNHKIDRLHMEPEVRDFNMHMEIFDEISERNNLEAKDLKKEEEVQALRDFQRERESRLFIPQEKKQIEKDVGTMVKEGTIIASKTLDSSQSEMVELTSCLKSQVSANEIIARKSSNLESTRHELEVHISELEEENLKHVERIHSMESHSRNLTDERDSILLKLLNSKSFAMNLQDEIINLEQKVNDVKRRWLEAQEESKYLKIENSKLQGTAESLVEECSLLRKSNMELRRQKMNLHDQCAVLQVELRESEKIISHTQQEVEALEEKYTSFLEEIASKEKAINLELDVLVQENKTLKDRLVLEERQLNQMYLVKTVEVEKLQKEVASLTGQMSKTPDDKKRTDWEAVLELEVSHLLSNNIILEAALQEVRGKHELSESSLRSIRMEYETQLSKLGCEPAASKQNQEVLMADREKLLNLLEDVKSNEEKQKSIAWWLKLKLRSSEYESLELVEKISSLTDQLQRATLPCDEVLALKTSLIEIRLENERKEASLQMLTGDYEELKAEKIIFLEKISSMQKEVSELDDCRRSKIALEEKVLQLEGDFTARHTLHPQDAQLKLDFDPMKRANSKSQRKTESLEDEKNEYPKRFQALEDDIKQKKEVKHDQDVSQNVDNQENCNTRSSPIVGIDPLLNIQLLEDKLAEAMEANDMYIIQLRRLLSEGEATKKNAFEENGSSIEKDLKDMHERYFHISLKYAEVQGERDQLALKLRSVNSNGRKWFL